MSVFEAMNGSADYRDNLNPILAPLATPLRHIYLHRPRTRRSKLSWVAIGACMVMLLFLLKPSGPKRPIPDFYVRHPSYPAGSPLGEESALLAPPKPVLSEDGTLPSSLRKSNPSFHLLVLAPDRSAGLCRTIFSSMILDYPPATLLDYSAEEDDDGNVPDEGIRKINTLHEYLSNSKQLEDDDLVLVVDGSDMWFQLPPEIIIRRFHHILKENNEKLRRKYGLAVVRDNATDVKGHVMQKYSHRILFGADKTCWPNTTLSKPSCVTVPISPWFPDSYGTKTDKGIDGTKNRPRWLNAGAAMGSAADMRLLYKRAAEKAVNATGPEIEQRIMSEIYGEQEYVRELEWRRTTNKWGNWIQERLLGIPRSANLTNISMPLEPGRRYEFGVGLDYHYELFLNTTLTHKEMEWIRYNNATKLNHVQMEHKVPRAHRINLPNDVKRLESPFIQPNETKNVMPPFNKTFDSLPNSKNRTWTNIPLATNVRTGNVPALLSAYGDRVALNNWWYRMWYQPWSRALLRKYMRSPRTHEASQASMLGDHEWDMRGGRGGVWTNNEEWLEWGEICSGYEDDVFDDDFGLWGQEEGEEFEKPVYNQFGMLISGKASYRRNRPNKPRRGGTKYFGS